MLAAGALAVVPATAGQGSAAEMGPSQVRRAPSSEDSSQARVIVKYRNTSALMKTLSASASNSSTQKVSPQHATLLGQRLGYALQDGRVLGESTQALRGQGLSSVSLVAKLREQPDVEWAVVDERRYISAVPNDPYYPGGQTSITPAVGQWYLRAPDSTLVSATNAPVAWGLTTGSSSVTVAVLDTGVIFDHPDLGRAANGGKLWPGYDFVSTGTGVSTNDSDGRDSDASDPGDYTTSTSCGRGTTISSSSWHGTQTASLVGAATNNATGMAGMGWNVMVLPVRVLGPCGGTDSDIIAGMRWAAGLNNDASCTSSSSVSATCNPHVAKVLSMSLGASGSCPTSYLEAISELTSAGVTVVVAAGNDEGLAVSSPANCTGALAVAGVRHTGTKVGYSNLGPQVTISAPAGNCVNSTGSCVYPILTATNAGTTTPTSNTYSNSTNYSVGTSFATPLVAGAVGLMLSVDATLTPANIKAKLQASARAFPSTGAASTVTACKAPSSATQDECYCTTTTCGAGMLDVGAAVASVSPTVSPPTAAITATTTTPTVGTAVTLSGSASTANGGRSISSYAWTLTSGSGLASLSASSGASVTFNTTAAGTVTVQLTVTDSAGATGTSAQTIVVQAASTTSTTTTSSSGGGGGGGAMSGLWVALLGLATVVLAWPRRRGL
jgi:serine protease